MTLNERIDTLEARLRAADEHLSVKRNALMARYTTLHLGGTADILVSPDRPEQITLVLKNAHELEIPVVIIGNGSNLLVKDGVCYVDFNEKFLERREGISSEVAIYSVVNSLAELSGIYKVQFLINGEIKKTYQNLDFSSSFERNLDIVEGEQ